MTYTPQQIDFIREYGNKELTEGVIIQRMGNYYKSIQGRHFINLQDGKYLKSTTSPIETISCEVIGHPVEWHDVFAKLKEMDCTIQLGDLSTNEGVIRIGYFEGLTRKIKKIPCNIALSPMDQPLLIEELLKLIK